MITRGKPWITFKDKKYGILCLKNNENKKVCNNSWPLFWKIFGGVSSEEKAVFEECNFR